MKVDRDDNDIYCAFMHSSNLNLAHVMCYVLRIQNQAHMALAFSEFIIHLRERQITHCKDYSMRSANSGLSKDY